MIQTIPRAQGIGEKIQFFGIDKYSHISKMLPLARILT